MVVVVVVVVSNPGSGDILNERQQFRNSHGIGLVLDQMLLGTHDPTKSAHAPERRRVRFRSRVRVRSAG